MNGILLLEKKSLDNIIELDVTKLPPASYLLRISNGQKTSTKKIIKQA
jgi:hypothetical protein